MRSWPPRRGWRARTPPATWRPRSWPPLVDHPPTDAQVACVSGRWGVHPMRRPRLLADARGFTMVELLVCLLILTIMAAIALPAFLDQRAKGEDSEAKLTIRTAAIALHAHYATENTFAATIAELEAIEPSLDEA